MNAAAASRSKPLPWIAWGSLIAGWLCLFAPLGASRAAVALALVAFGAVLAIVAMVRGGARRGLAPLLAALLVTPALMWFGSAMPGSAAGAGLMSNLPGSDASTNDVANTGTNRSGASSTGNAATLPDAVASAAFRTAVTAYELSSAYATDPKAADAAYKGQRLLVTGMIATLDADRNYLTMGAGDFPSVQVDGLSKDVRGTLRGNAQITVACNGAGASGGVAIVDGCTLAQ